MTDKFILTLSDYVWIFFAWDILWYILVMIFISIMMLAVYLCDTEFVCRDVLNCTNINFRLLLFSTEKNLLELRESRSTSATICGSRSMSAVYHKAYFIILRNRFLYIFHFPFLNPERNIINSKLAGSYHWGLVVGLVFEEEISEMDFEV